ncbi:MAG: RNA polymerase sigma-54 factor [Candidatus Anoxychlamydiales bacterium]|nr:RNA polymerase sigma-54 factor [Candidatus Anoxychlamydiales bacterium]
MAFQSFQTKQLQTLNMTYFMKRAFLILQMTNQELKNFVEMEIEKNPILEIADNKNSSTKISEEKKNEFFSAVYKPSLFEHLMVQAKQSFSTKKEIVIAENIIGNLDEKGYFTLDLDSLAKNLKTSNQLIFKVLNIVKTFDPKGIAAKNLKDRILSQIEDVKSLEYKIFQNYFDDILKNKIHKIAKKLNLSRKKTQKTIEKTISSSIFDVTTTFSKNISNHISADIIIKKTAKNWIIEIDEKLTNFNMNKDYVKIIESDNAKSSKHFIISAKILMKNIITRRKLLFDIAYFIIKNQQSFLLEKTSLNPLFIKDVASYLKVHPSTISRAIANKYIECPVGLLSIKSFFAASKNDKNIDFSKAKSILKQILDLENKQQPLSDQKLSVLMREKGYPLHRRTITKYRKKLKISSSRFRKKYD